MPSRRAFLRLAGAALGSAMLDPVAKTVETMAGAQKAMASYSVETITLKASAENLAWLHNQPWFQQGQAAQKTAKLGMEAEEASGMEWDLDEWIGEQRQKEALFEALRWNDAVDAAAHREQRRYAAVTRKADGTGYNVTLKRRTLNAATGAYETRRAWQATTQLVARNYEQKLPGVIRVDNKECARGRMIVLTEPGSHAERFFQTLMSELEQANTTASRA